MAYNSWANSSSSRVTSYLYIGNKSVRVNNICSEAQKRKLGVGDEVSVGDEETTLYIPNDMRAASNYFRRGYYENEIAGELETAGGELKIGVRCNTKNKYYWTCFDNFRLYYFGSIPAEEVLDIDPALILQTDPSAPIFDLSGRCVGTGSQKLETLPKGIYIQNGRKFVKQ